MKQKLVLTFVKESEQPLETVVDAIKSSYTITDNKIYHFDVTHIDQVDNESSSKTFDSVLTYNVTIDDSDHLYPKTLVCHRRKENGIITLFTMNGLNSLKEKYGNELNWTKLHNKLILVKDTKLTIATLRLKKLINF